jgi:1,2-diacylglycerol 3-alpha-glucosyltransferase
VSGAPSLTVAIFGESYLPYLSGVTVATEALARGLEAAGHRVVLAVPRPAGSAQPTGGGAAGPDPQMAWLPSYQGPPPAPPDYRMPWPVPSGALARVRAARPDVVHAQSPFVSGLMARRVARAVGAPLVFTHHTRFADYRHYLGPFAAPGSALMEAYLGAFRAGCAAVVAPADDLAAEIEAAVASRREGRRPIVRTIPTGIDVEALRGLAPADPRRIAGWPSDAIVAVSVGRLAREKSTDVLLDAFAGAARSDPRLRLVLVGDGPLRREIERRLAGGTLGDRVLLTGRLPRLEALSVAAGCDLFAFASRTETQGLVLAEALAVGLPVVTLDGPGVRSSVREGVDGVVVPRSPGRSAALLAEALRSLAADSDRRATLARSARDGAVRFAAESRIEEMVALYRSLRFRAR